MNPHLHGQLVYNKRGKDIQSGKDSFFSKNWTVACKRIKLDYFLKPHIKINWKCFKDLNVRPGVIKLLEENISRILFDINCSNIFLNLSPQIRETKAKIIKCYLIKCNICTDRRDNQWN